MSHSRVHPFPNCIVTPGVRQIIDNGAGWLVNAIFSHLPKVLGNADERLHDFQIWTLKVDLKERRGVLECKADTGEPAVVTQIIGNTTFDREEIKFYLERGGDYKDEKEEEIVYHYCLMLPDER